MQARPINVAVSVLLAGGAAFGLTLALASTVPPAPAQIQPVQLPARPSVTTTVASTTAPEPTPTTLTSVPTSATPVALVPMAPASGASATPAMSGSTPPAVAAPTIVPGNGARPPAEARPVTVPANVPAHAGPPADPRQSGDHRPENAGNGVPGVPAVNEAHGRNVDAAGSEEDTDASGERANELDAARDDDGSSADDDRTAGASRSSAGDSGTTGQRGGASRRGNDD